MRRVLRWWLAAGAVLGASIAISACGSEDGFPPPAEPGLAPEVEDRSALPGDITEVGNEAEGVAVDSQTGTVAVALRDPDRLALLDSDTNELIERLDLDESARHLQMAGPGGPVLSTAERTDFLIETTLPGGTKLPGGERQRLTLVGDFPHDAAQLGERIYSGDEGGDTISVVEDGEVIEAVPAPEQPGGIAVVGEERPLIAVVAVAERVLELYDPETMESVAQFDAGVGPTHLVKGPGELFYIADTQGDAILVYEAGPEPRFVDRVNVPSRPYGIAFDEAGQRLWVTQTEENRALGFSTEDRVAPKRLYEVPTVQQANTIGVDERTGALFIASRTEGVVQRVDESDYLPTE